ncbi:MAG: glycosyltransferase family 39 protein, partial [Actinomycetia bacterium]|nr:glycosyltransferase family 39 protein [Actinomycetes bacterium]
MHTPSRIPAAVWWITALNIALVMLYTIVLPTYRAPDEPEHFDLVRYVATAREYPAFDGLSLNEQTVESLWTTRLGRKHLDTSDIADRDARSTFDELAADVQSEVPNRMPQHPPAYYGLMGLVYGLLSFVGLERASYDVVVMVTRASNVIFAAAIPVLAYLTTVRLSRNRMAGIAAAAVPLAIPQLIHIQGSVNNDNLWILLASLTTYFVARVLRGDITSRTALMLGLLVGLSLFTKAFALVMPLWIAILYLIVWR